MKGVKAIGFAPFLASDPVMNTVTGVVDLPLTIAPLVPTGTIARVEVKATGNNIVDTGTFDEATRTNEYVAVNTFFIPGIDIELRNQIQGYAGILQTIFIEDYNDKFKRSRTNVYVNFDSSSRLYGSPYGNCVKNFELVN